MPEGTSSLGLGMDGDLQFGLLEASEEEQGVMCGCSKGGHERKVTSLEVLLSMGSPFLFLQPPGPGTKERLHSRAVATVPEER